MGAAQLKGSWKKGAASGVPSTENSDILGSILGLPYLRKLPSLSGYRLGLMVHLPCCVVSIHGYGT